MLIANRELHTYHWNGVRKVSVTDALAMTNCIKKEWYTDAGRERGIDVHAATYLYDLGKLDRRTITAEIEPFLQAWIGFRKAFGFEPDLDLREKALYSPEWDFAGSPDAPGLVDGYPCIVEIKSGGLPKWARLQLAAYDILLGPAPMQRRRISVHLQASGRPRPRDWSEEPDEDDDRNNALAAIRLAQWMVREEGWPKP